MNHINLSGIATTVETLKSDPSKSKKTHQVKGEWNPKDTGPQFSATVSYEKGESTLVMDSPTGLGGTGNAPNPIQYCLYGMAACFTSTFVTIATQKNVSIDSLSVTAETTTDMTRVLGLTNNPLTEGIRLTLNVNSSASRETLSQIESEARNSCPAVYCVTNPIPLSISIVENK